MCVLAMACVVAQRVHLQNPNYVIYTGVAADQIRPNECVFDRNRLLDFFAIADE
jgi:hypothetical protein